jgi:opacity protein-like surface antigen
MDDAGVSAQTADVVKPSAAPPIEVTPFISLGSDFSPRVGASIAFALTRDLSIEPEVGYRRNEIGAVSASANLLYELPRLGRVSPYAATGIGMEQYGVPQVTPVGVGTRRTAGIGLNLGTGLKVSMTDRWSYRTDVRWLNFQGNAPEGWRLYNGATLRFGKR